MAKKRGYKVTGQKAQTYTITAGQNGESIKRQIEEEIEPTDAKINHIEIIGEYVVVQIKTRARENWENFFNLINDWPFTRHTSLSKAQQCATDILNTPPAAQTTQNGYAPPSP